MAHELSIPVKETPGRPVQRSQDFAFEPDDDDIEGRYGATRQATEQLDAVEELEAEFGEELDAEEEGQKPAPEPPKAKPKTEDDGVDVGAILSDIGRGSIEAVGLQAVGGVRDAAQETLEAMDSLAVWLNTHVADLTVFDPDEDFEFNLPEIPQAQTVTGGVARGIIQFVAGMIGAGKFTGLSKLKNLSKAGEAGRLGLQGAIADGIARDPNEENLANLLRELTGEQKNAVLNFMSSDPDDSEAVARVKKAFEGFGVGALVDGVILGAGAVRASRALRKAAKVGAATAAAGAALSADAPEAQARAAEDPTGTPAVEPAREGEVQTASLVGPIIKGLLKAGAKKAAEKAPTFFSNAGKAIDGAKFEKGTAEQFLALPGLKREEIEFTGLDEFLRSKKGSVTKQEVLDFLDQNGVKLGETVKDQSFDTLSDPVSRQTKFETYTLPGGENYRELLIQLPERKPRGFAEWQARMDAKYGERANILMSEEEAAEGTALRGTFETDRAPTFTGSHFDEPNVLVHVRFNERTTAEGKRVLFIEEIQSDWHAKGRRQGYASDVKSLDAGEQQELNALINRVHDPRGPVGGDLTPAEHDRMRALHERSEGGQNAVPDAPFKKTWHELGLKRMIRYAAENDFDGVAWTKGAQQADRYDLSKQVDTVDVINHVDGGRFVDVRKGGQSILDMRYDKNGVITESRAEFEGKPLSDVLGKELADKILAVPERASPEGVTNLAKRFEGLDLRVGGEGLKTFYDRMLPQTANRIGKKFGAKVGEARVTTGLEDGQAGRFLDDAGLTMDEFNQLSREERRALLHERGGATTVHTFPITPKLKDETLSNGLPLFSVGTVGAAGLTADQIDVSPPDILLSDPFVPGEPPKGEETEVAGALSGAARAFRRAQEGADEITRQRQGPGAQPQTLVGDLEKPLVETIEGGQPQRFLDETGAPPLPDKAININLGKLDTSDDIKRAIDETANLFGKDIDEARRGVQTNEATEALASDMGLTVEQLLKRRQGEAFNAETALAARRMLASSASQLVDLAKKAADNGGDRELLAFRRALVIHAAIQQQVSGLTAEAGRALQSFKILAGSEREMTRNVQEMIDAAGGSRMSRKMAERLADAAESGALTRAQLNQVVRKGALTRTSDAFLEVWINGLLSGPTTQAVNLLSNALVAAWQIPVRLVASKLPGGGVEAVAAGETKALLYGMMQGYSEGLILAGRALRTGESTDVLAKIDLPQRRAISAEAFNMSGIAGQAVDLMGEVVRLPGRGLIAGDELFKAVGYRMELSARAFRQASSEGLEGEAMARRVDEILRNPPDDIRLAAIDAGRYQTFTKPLGEGGRSYQSVVNAVPILRLLTPFIRTPVNIMKFVGEGTVLAPLSKNVRAELAAGGARRQIATAKIAMGSMASAFAADMASRGLMTGNGPSNPDARKIWLTTHQPNSIKVGDQWVAYGRLEPLGAFFGIAADIQMIMGDLDGPERDHLATALVIAIGKNVTSKTFLRGLSEAARTLNDPDRFGERYIQQLAGTIVPTLGAQITRAGLPGIVEGDPVLRDVRSIYDKLCSRVPTCSSTLPPRRNIWGEPIVLGGGIGPDIMSPIYTKDVKLDPVSDEMMRLGVRQQMPSRQIGGVELTPQEYDEYNRISGQSAKKELSKLIERSDYKSASDGPDGLKALAIKKVFAATRDAARKRILKDRKFRDLQGRVMERDAERRRKLRAPAAIQLPAVP